MTNLEQTSSDSFGFEPVINPDEKADRDVAGMLEHIYRFTNGEQDNFLAYFPCPYSSKDILHKRFEERLNALTFVSKSDTEGYFIVDKTTIIWRREDKYDNGEHFGFLYIGEKIKATSNTAPKLVTQQL